MPAMSGHSKEHWTEDVQDSPTGHVCARDQRISRSADQRCGVPARARKVESRAGLRMSRTLREEEQEERRKREKERQEFKAAQELER